MLRLFATPKTTATRPSRLKDILPPWAKRPAERPKEISGAGERASAQPVCKMARPFHYTIPDAREHCTAAPMVSGCPRLDMPRRGGLLSLFAPPRDQRVEASSGEDEH